jgi:hypothetical protein
VLQDNAFEVISMHRRELKSPGRMSKSQQRRDAAVLAKARRPNPRANKRIRGVRRNETLPFIPPEVWHEPTGGRQGYRIIVQPPGRGFRHILTPQEIRARLGQFPDDALAGLEVVQLSQMTRKKHGFPCYGMQWGSSLYLYPIETGLVEYYQAPPGPNLLNEARMYGGRWSQESRNVWKLTWTDSTVRDFYLNNILIHELGHLLDDRNTRYVDRERYAEWFALEYGYKRTSAGRSARKIVRRHHKARSRRIA